MIISNIIIKEPYSVLSFLYSGLNDQKFPFEYLYEVLPAYKSSDGIWIATDESIFIEDDIKSLVTKHKVLWTEDVIEEYTTYMDSLIPDNPVLQQQIDEILASL